MRRSAFVVSVLGLSIAAAPAVADERSPLLAGCPRGDSIAVDVFNAYRESIEILLRLPGSQLWTSVSEDGVRQREGEPVLVCPGFYDVKIAALRTGKTLYTASAMKLSGMKGFRVTPKGILVPLRIVTDKRRPTERGTNRIVVHNHMLCALGDGGVRIVVTFKNGATVEGVDVVDFAVDKSHPLPASVVATNARTKIDVATTTITKLGADLVLDDDCQFEH